MIREPDEQYWKVILAATARHALNSPDPSTQNGAVLVVNGKIDDHTWAVNEFPEGVRYIDERWERPLKYSVIEHAERGAIFMAAKHGIKTSGATLVCPWAACADCARAIIRSGISHLVTLAPREGDTHDRWGASIDIAMVMLEEAKVKVTYVRGPLDCGVVLRRNGEPFIP